ncbi:MAG: DUF1080 domain-containing protein [Planctomycetia bacterium]|nr:DUF1080 domain-containing protein [Planctomycetia bacterium]
MMRITLRALTFLAVCTLPLAIFAAECPCCNADKPVPEGFTKIFDGKTLKGWDGDPTFWSVQNGCITGISTPEKVVKYNTFLIWEGEVADFELLVDFKLTNHNSGIQYRAFRNEGRAWSLGGYQGDIADPPHMGIVYGENFRGILAHRGQKTKIGADHKPVVVEQIGDSAELLKKVNMDGWNTYRIVAKGNVCTQYINGVKMSEVVDEDTIARASGLIGLQMHTGPAMKVEFKNVFLKKL